MSCIEHEGSKILKHVNGSLPDLSFYKQICSVIDFLFSLLK